MKPDCIKENMSLKLARTKAKMSQLELSIKTQITQTDFSLIERGLKLPTEEQAKTIADILQFNTDEIFPDLLSRGQND